MDGNSTLNGTAVAISKERKQRTNRTTRSYLLDTQQLLLGHIKSHQELPITAERAELIQRLQLAVAAVERAFSSTRALNNETPLEQEGDTAA